MLTVRASTCWRPFLPLTHPSSPVSSTYLGPGAFREDDRESFPKFLPGNKAKCLCTQGPCTWGPLKAGGLPLGYFGLPGTVGGKPQAEAGRHRGE